MSKLPTHMSADEIVAEIKRLHDDVENAAYRMGELSRLLLLRSRSTAARTAASESQRRSGPVNTIQASSRKQDPASSEAHRIASANVVYANAWLRCSGLVVQAIRRTKVADRSLATEKRDAATEVKENSERAARNERREERREARREPHRTGTPNGDLMELYGKEILDDAAR